MKKIASYILAAAAFIAVSCDNNIPKTGTINNALVEEVVFDASIQNGMTIYVGQTFSIPEHVSFLPIDATNVAQYYESSDPSVADVSDSGVLTAKKIGNCDIIVYVGKDGVCGEFHVNVEPVPDIQITDIILILENEYKIIEGTSMTIDLKRRVSVSPDDYTEQIVWSVSPETVATVDEDGILTISGFGKATVTAAAKNHPDVKASREIEVSKLVEIEYDRSSWTMTCSQNPLPNLSNRNNSLTAMLDGKDNTVFCITRPGKNSGGVNLSSVDKDNYEISFVIDMKQSQPFNYFSITHLSTSGPDFGTRLCGFTEISGSNDGENFTVISSNVDFTDKSAVVENPSTGKIAISSSNYRYVKFMMKGTSCYDPSGKNNGNTCQIKEFYLGYTE